MGNNKIEPQVFETLFHGGNNRALGLPDGISNEMAVKRIYEHGLEGRGSNIDLYVHKEASPNSAFRGTTSRPFSQERDAGAGEWVGDGEFVIELRRVKGYDVNAAMDSHPESTSLRDQLFGNSKRGEWEVAIPAEVRPEEIARVGIRYTKDNGRPVIDWIPRP